MESHLSPEMTNTQTVLLGREISIQEIEIEEPGPSKGNQTTLSQCNMNMLPPEVVEKILDFLVFNEQRNVVLDYRLVCVMWKKLLYDIVEKTILSRKLQSFPTLQVCHSEKKKKDGIYVCHSSPMLEKNYNPFPFKSLVLNGSSNVPRNNYLPDDITYTYQINLSQFKSSYMESLTSLTLKNVVVPNIKTMMILLGSTQCLKVLRLVNFFINDDVPKTNMVLPTKNQMPKLRTLEIKHDLLTSNYWCSYNFTNEDSNGWVDRERYIAYIWTIASYSNQIVCLDLEVTDPLPGLHKQTDYYFTTGRFANQKRTHIASTTDSAFSNLTVLKLRFHDHFTIRESEVLKLKQLFVINANPSFNFDFHKMLVFINSCHKTLESLHLNVGWYSAFTWPDKIIQNHSLVNIIVDYMSNNSPFPKLKHLTIRYIHSDDRSQDVIISTFLAIFPALETLNLLYYSKCSTSVHVNEIQSDTTVSLEVTNEISNTKTRYVVLENEMFRKIKKYLLWRKVFYDVTLNWRELTVFLTRDLLEFKMNYYVKTNDIFKDLESLGITKKQFLIERFVQREKVWNVCPKLKKVIVSSNEKALGDICVLNRPV